MNDSAAIEPLQPKTREELGLDKLTTVHLAQEWIKAHLTDEDLQSEYKEYHQLAQDKLHAMLKAAGHHPQFVVTTGVKVETDPDHPDRQFQHVMIQYELQNHGAYVAIGLILDENNLIEAFYEPEENIRTQLLT